MTTDGHEHPRVESTSSLAGVAIASAAVPSAADGRGWRAIFGGPGVSFGLRRLRRLLVSLWVLITASFLMLHLVPGDPVRTAMGASATQETVDARREALGLNEPLLEQYFTYLKHLASGDLGESLVSGVSVSSTIGDRLPATLEIAVAAFVLTMIVAIPLGVVMAVVTRGGRRRAAEISFTSASMVVDAVPNFVLATILVFFLGVQQGWLPVAGRTDLTSYVIPVLALAASPIAVISRIMRVEMLNVLDADYVRTARAKRLASVRIYFRHALPNAATATLTVGGLLLGGLIASTVLVENVLAWPGLGGTIVSSILARDYPLAQGIVLVYGIAILLINTIVDFVIAALDPRSTIRES